MEYNFDEIIDRRHTNSAKFVEMVALFGSDVMHLGVADMDYRSQGTYFKCRGRKL